MILKHHLHQFHFGNRFLVFEKVNEFFSPDELVQQLELQIINQDVIQIQN